MVKYVIQRLIAAFFTFVVILIVVFFVLHSMPGDIIDFSPKLDPAIREMIMDKYHLNDSLIEQFQYTMADYLHFDFGYSLKVRPACQYSSAFWRDFRLQFSLIILRPFLFCRLDCSLELQWQSKKIRSTIISREVLSFC